MEVDPTLMILSGISLFATPWDFESKLQRFGIDWAGSGVGRSILICLCTVVAS